MTGSGQEGTARTRPPAQQELRGQPVHDVFVSYSSHDKPVADAIVSRLEQAGIRCWVAPRDVIPGNVWGEAIVDAIETSRLMVVVLSGESNQSRHVHREVERAIANDVVVIPFRIESIEPSGAMAYYLASEHWLDAMTPPLDAHIAQLANVAGSLLGCAPISTASPTSSAEPPPSAGPRLSGQAPGQGRPRWLVPVLIAGASAALVGLVAALLFVFVLNRSPQPKMVPLAQLTRGDCVQAPEAYAQNAASRLRFWGTDIPWPYKMPVVSCGDTHSGEVFFAGNIWPKSLAYPGSRAVDKQYQSRCGGEFNSYVGAPDSKTAFTWTGTTPDKAAWAGGDRRIFCIAYDRTGKEFQGSIRHSG